MGKRNQADPDEPKSRKAGEEAKTKPSAGPGHKPDTGKSANRKPAPKKAAVPKPTAKAASDAAKKTAPKPGAKKPASPPRAAKASAEKKQASSEKKPAPARRRDPVKTQPEISAAPAPGRSPEANAETPATLGIQVQASAARPAPAPAGNSRVVLMVRDPEWLYGYWEISENDRETHAIGQPQGAPPLLLRLYDQGEDTNPKPTGLFVDTNIIPDAGGWYLRIPEGGGHWSAALGYLNYQGDFVPLAQSNVVATPRPLAGEWTEETWGPTGEELELAEVAGLAGGAVQEHGTNGQSRLIQRASRLMNYLRGLGSSEKFPRPGASEQVPRFGASELGIPRPGASEQVPRFGASELARPAASERYGASELGLPKPGGAGAVMEKTFWLQVHTELIVYGATEPDAKVTVQGVPIQLRPDGTFTLRFALPDGEQVIPVHAINADGDMERTITPIVKKRTV